MGKEPDANETLKTYQDKLKALDPLLTETVITNAVIKDWQTQTNFKTAATVETELKKIFKNGTLDENFKKIITKADSEITDGAKLFQKKKAQEIITLIRKWEYDKATDQVKTQKIIKMNMDKRPGDTLTEEEITTGLYKLAISEYKQKSDSEIQEWEKAQANNGDNKDKEEHGWFSPLDGN